MKKSWKSILSLAILFLSYNSLFAKSITLAEAIKKHQISVTAKGLGGYNGECLSLSVSNKTKYPLQIQVEAGTIFQSEDEAVQDLMVTQEQVFALKPISNKKVSLFTMCIQSMNMGPSTGDIFFFNRMANGDLMTLAQLINKEKYQNSTAQSAVWSITDGASIKDVYGSDTAMVKNLARLVSRATGASLSDFDLRPRRHQITSIKSSLEIVLEKPALNTALRIYNASTGELFQELFSAKNLKPGFHQFRFGLHHTFEDSTKFLVKLESDSIIAEKEATKSDTIPKLQPLTETFVTFDLAKPTRVQHGIYNQDDKLYAISEPGRNLKAGFHRFDFIQSRGLPIGQTYFFKVKDMDGNTIASQEIFMNKTENKLYKPITKRGTYRFKLKAEDPKYGLKLAVYDATGKAIWVVFSDSRMREGMKQIPYVFQHRQGPDASFTIKLTDKEGNTINEQCIENCN